MGRLDLRDDCFAPEADLMPLARALEILARRGLAHAYVPFEGEQHGFRRAENIRTAIDGELFFYSRVFGFDAPRPEGVNVVERRS